MLYAKLLAAINVLLLLKKTGRFGNVWVNIQPIKSI